MCGLVSRRLIFMSSTNAYFSKQVVAENVSIDSVAVTERMVFESRETKVRRTVVGRRVVVVGRVVVVVGRGVVRRPPPPGGKHPAKEQRFSETAIIANADTRDKPINPDSQSLPCCIPRWWLQSFPA